MQKPLSDRLRPKNLEQIVGQDHILDKKSLLRSSILSQNPLSILLYGPPGCGKTTLARIYGNSFSQRFIPLSATYTTSSEIRKIIEDADKTPLFSFPVILFVDEIHRFNKAKQDIFLPLIEEGKIILIGATTENPSFCINNALLSRLRTFALNPLENKDLRLIIDQYESKIKSLPLTKKAKDYLIESAGGDGRYLFNMIENLQNISEKELCAEEVSSLFQKKPPLFDKNGQNHHAQISVFHKAIRGSDPDGALYWLARMLNAGQDPLYIARRLIRISIEDVGLADLETSKITLEAFDIHHKLGSPEGDLALAKATIYLALSPKSNSVYTAFDLAKQQAEKTSSMEVPIEMINPSTKFMKDEGYGKDYLYDHDSPLGFFNQNFFPKKMNRVKFFNPVLRGFERELQKRIEYFEKLRNSK